jgi:LysM repeat protein
MAGIGGRSSLILGIASIALAAGCATSDRSARIATYGAPYGGVEGLPQDGRIDDLRYDASAGQAQIYAAYEGVDGARLAHRLYGEARAEQLDGACEHYVKIVRGETLYDIAQYCDVPVSMLVEQNPVVRNARHVEAGQIVEVPQLFNAERHALAGGFTGAGVEFASWYVVQPGDTLNDIAARHLVSADAIANLNPGVDVGRLATGVQLRLPAVAPAGVHDAAAAPVVAGALPYAYGPASAYTGEGGYAPPAEVTAMMPYAGTIGHVSGNGAVPKSLSLAVDRRTVSPGGEVMLSAVGLPANTAVSLYRGANGADLEFIKTVVTDAQGSFSEPMTVKGSSDIGGVIFRATIDATGKQLQSPRVGVDKINPAE